MQLSAVAVKRTVFEEMGGFLDTFPEDLEMWARVAFKYPIAWTSRVEMVWRRDVGKSLLKTAKPTKDHKMIDTLREGLSKISSPDMKKDILNLIGKYYKYYSIAYLKSGDRENAVRCIRKSIRYMSGHLVVKSVVLRIILLMPRRVWKVLRYASTLF